MGAMVFGNPLRERIQFNEISLWSGGANEGGGYKVDSFGTYQSFGDLWIEVPEGAAEAKPEAYERVLNLREGVQRTSWRAEGARHVREVFASRQHEVVVVRWTCDRPGGIRARVRMTDPRMAAPGLVHARGVGLGEAALSNGLRYAAHAVVLNEGGGAAPDGDAYVVTNANAMTIVLAAATDYAMDPAKNFRSGVAPEPVVRRQAAAAAALGHAALRAAHVRDQGAVMGRVALDLGATPAEVRAWPTKRRIDRYAGGEPDPELETLIFQYGRYLLAGSSRPGGLPANLQGLWADGLKPPWYADYHNNINIQMNYWQAEPANLADCHEALFDWVIACVPESRRATVKAFGEKTPGWTMRTSVNAFGGNGWQWNLPASAWLAQHFWEHYAFGGDREFLKGRAWPVFRDVCEYWLSQLKDDGKGRLVVPKGWSPEHGPREDGVAHDQQIVWDLFSNTLDAAKVLGVDDEFTRRVSDARGRLLGPQVGSWGQLMEWTTERPELEKSGHRHTSHLFAVYPGRQISVARTPELAKAAAVSLESRGTSGDSRRSWTWPWRTAMWARLGDAERAHAMVRGLFQHNTMANLFTTHPPFQIDGNLGITAGVCEMLLQSHAGEVQVLPALPKAWAAGSYRGLRARGGFTVDAEWSGGRPVRVAVQSVRGNECRLRVAPGGRVTDAAGKAVPTRNEDGVLVFATRAGSAYRVAW
jgi:alpha-L-fucosidase 2